MQTRKSVQELQSEKNLTCFFWTSYVQFVNLLHKNNFKILKI